MLIRFFGLENTLNEWRKVVAKRVGKTVQPTSFKKDRYGIRFFADCELTEAEREELMKDWYEVAPHSGMLWNRCITFQEVKK